MYSNNLINIREGGRGGAGKEDQVAPKCSLGSN